MQKSLIVKCVTILAPAVLFGASVHAQTDPLADPGADALAVRLTPGLWLPRLRGNAKLAGLPRAQDLELDTLLDLGGLEPTFTGEIAITKGDTWHMQLSGFDFSTEGQSTFATRADFGELQLRPGDRYRSSFDITSVSADLAITAFRPFEFDAATGTGVNMRFAPAFGVRYVDVDQTVELLAGGRQSTGGEWINPHVGFVAELDWRPANGLPLGRGIGLVTELNAGPALGRDGGFMYHIRTNLTWHVTDSASLIIGYRLVEMNVEADGYELNGGLQGLFVGGSISF